MPLDSGTRLGPYEVLAPLGAGGMGEVYRAHDTRLGRSVAIKVLPRHLSTTPEVRARFEREARTISALNHPHICMVHDVGREHDTDYMVMELVEGETLAARLERGPLPTADVLRLGAQIADALDRAHRAGVVHRDLKPGNIMLTRSGAKLLDFGLARHTGLAGPGASAAGLTQSPTVAQPLTAEGTLLGTFQYMSPEQLEGREADARADLWALGCVLYEMATGRRAFDGATQASLISAIMRDVPRPMSELAPMNPPALERLVRQCLAKDPDERWQSAGDVRRELEWLARSNVTPGAATASRAPHWRTVAIAAAAAAVTIAALAWWAPWSRRAPDPRLVRFDLEPPAGTAFNGPAEAELSPDGATLAFTASDSSGTSHIWLRPLAASEARVVPGTEAGTLPFWSPDSRSLGFFAAGKLRKVALDGTPPVVLCDAPDGRGGAWSKDGEVVFASNNQGPLSRVSAAGGAPVLFTRLDRNQRGHRYPQFLPDGRHVLYVSIGQGEEVSTWVIARTGGTPKEVCRAGSGARYVAPGWLVYLEGNIDSPQRRLLARRFDASQLRPAGDAVLLIDRVNATNFGYANVTSSDDGTLVVQHWADTHGRLMWRDRHGKPLGVAIEDFAGDAASLSSDGRSLAYDDPALQALFVLDLGSGVATRLTFDRHLVSGIVWSRDNRQLAYSRLSEAHGWEIYLRGIDGAGSDSALFRGPGLFSYVDDWTPDGRWLVAQCTDSTGQYDLWRIPIQGGGSPEIYQHTPENEGGAAVSPDGRWIAYLSGTGNARELFVQAFPTPGAKHQISVEHPGGVQWAADGRSLIVLTSDGQFLSVEVSTDQGFRQGATSELFKSGKAEFLVGIVAGEQRFLSNVVRDLSAVSRLEVVLGWPRLLAQAR